MKFWFWSSNQMNQFISSERIATLILLTKNNFEKSKSPYRETKDLENYFRKYVCCWVNFGLHCKWVARSQERKKWAKFRYTTDVRGEVEEKKAAARLCKGGGSLYRATELQKSSDCMLQMCWAVLLLEFLLWSKSWINIS